MFRSLYAKLAAVLTALFFIVGIIFIAVAFFSADIYQKEAGQRLNRDLARHIASQKPLIQKGRINRPALAELFHMLMVINPGIEIYLLDPAGRILAYSAPRERIKRESVDLQPVRRWLAGGTPLPLLGDDPRNPAGRKAFSAARIPERGDLEGYLYVILAGEAYDSVAQKLKGSFILQLSAWIVAAGLCFALVAGLVLFALLTGRLKRLVKAVEAFKREGAVQPFDFPLKKGRPADEIDRLALTFKEMAARIEDQMDQLRKSDRERRQLVANVSHDLRTPLATLQGYIETLLIKDSDLSLEERKSYLETAIRHCERLNRLVNELLELAKLESFEINLCRERFNPGELVYDVVQKFKLKAAAKDIDLTARIDSELPFVSADIGMIERVLENLIENALTYTPAGGNVKIDLTAGRQDVFIRISDTGQGIPPAELPYIFNRFYQLDKSRKDTLGHSGLGLAIAKRIIELHDRSISVQSTLNAGTAFSFPLPVAVPV